MLDNRPWYAAEGASTEAIADLKSVAPAGLPESYFVFLAASNGGEGPLAVQPLWLQLLPAEEAAQVERNGAFREDFAGLFVIGSNGAGEGIAFDLRQKAPFPVVAFDMSISDMGSSVKPVAPTFDAAMDLIRWDEQ